MRAQHGLRQVYWAWVLHGGCTTCKICSQQGLSTPQGIARPWLLWSPDGAVEVIADVSTACVSRSPCTCAQQQLDCAVGRLPYEAGLWTGGHGQLHSASPPERCCSHQASSAFRSAHTAAAPIAGAQAAAERRRTAKAYRTFEAWSLRILVATFKRHVACCSRRRCEAQHNAHLQSTLTQVRGDRWHGRSHES